MRIECDTQQCVEALQQMEPVVMGGVVIAYLFIVFWQMWTIRRQEGMW